MKFTYFGKKAGFNRTKDFIVLGVCAAIYLAFFIFILTPPGNEFIAKVKSITPFMDLIENALADIERMLALLFEKFGRSLEATAVAQEMSALSIEGIFFDLSKLMVSSLVQCVIFLAFSFLFLHAKDFGFVSVLFGGEKEDFLYKINESLLLGISVFVGSLLGNLIVEPIIDPVMKIDGSRRVWTAFMIFVIIYVVFSAIFMLKTWISSGKSYGPLRSLIKTMFVNIIPEVFVYFLTNTMVVFTFNIVLSYGLRHYFTWIALFFLVAWLLFMKIVSEWFGRLVRGFVYFGQLCPFTGLLWLPATVTFVLVFYTALAINYHSFNLADFMEASLMNFPFLDEWMSGKAVFDVVINNFDVYKNEFFVLVAICTVAALFQYLSSSYTVTLFTQVIGRALLIMGIGFVILALVNIAFYAFLPDIVTEIEYKSFAGFVAVLVYFLLFVLEPYVAVQGVFTAFGILLSMQMLPVTKLGIFGMDISSINYGMFCGAVAMIIGINLLISLLQNLAAFFEKKFFAIKLM